MVSQVAQLTLAEAVRVDRDRLEKLVDEYGTHGAERLVGRLLEELAVRLNQTERAWHAGDLGQLHDGALDLSGLADRLGLLGLARSAASVAEVSLRDDPAALGATVARMMRVGEASLMSAWNLNDMTL